MSLIWAKDAINYVRNTLGMMSCNRQADMRVDPDAEKRKIQASIDAFAAFSARPPGNWQYDLMKEVGFYETARAGNCDEMAKVAFVYLASRGIQPVEHAYLTGAESRVRLTGTNTHEDVEPDHAVVVIGRTMGVVERGERARDIISMAPYQTWNFGTIICDPWSKRAYMAHELGTEMQKINRVSGGSTQFSSEYRVDDREPWNPRLG